MARHETTGTGLLTQVLRVAAVGGVAAVLGVQLLGSPVTTASAGGFGGPRAASVDYCFSGSNLILRVINAQGGTVPSTASNLQILGTITLAKSTGGFDVVTLQTSKKTFSGDVLFTFADGSTKTVNLPNGTTLPTVNIPNKGTARKPNRPVSAVVTATYTCSDSTTRTATVTVAIS